MFDISLPLNAYTYQKLRVATHSLFHPFPSLFFSFSLFRNLHLAARVRRLFSYCISCFFFNYAFVSYIHHYFILFYFCLLSLLLFYVILSFLFIIFIVIFFVRFPFIFRLFLEVLPYTNKRLIYLSLSLSLSIYKMIFDFQYNLIN